MQIQGKPGSIQHAQAVYGLQLENASGDKISPKENGKGEFPLTPVTSAEYVIQQPLRNVHQTGILVPQTIICHFSLINSTGEIHLHDRQQPEAARTLVYTIAQ